MTPSTVTHVHVHILIADSSYCSFRQPNQYGGHPAFGHMGDICKHPLWGISERCLTTAAKYVMLSNIIGCGDTSLPLSMGLLPDT